MLGRETGDGRRETGSQATPDAEPRLAVGSVAEKVPARRLLGLLHRRHLGDEEPVGANDVPVGERLQDARVALFLAEGVGRVGEADRKARADVGRQPPIAVGGDDLVPGAGCLVRGAWCGVPGAWCLVRGTW